MKANKSPISADVIIWVDLLMLLLVIIIVLLVIVFVDDSVLIPVALHWKVVLVVLRILVIIQCRWCLLMIWPVSKFYRDRRRFLLPKICVKLLNFSSHILFKI